MLADTYTSIRTVAQARVATAPISVILFAATLYPAMLCFMHTHFFRVVTSTVGFTEFLIYLACLAVLIRPVRVEFFIMATLVVAYLLLLTLFRGEIELKGFRDVMIPLLFYWVGRQVGSMDFADRIFKRLIWVVLAFGLLELFFLDWYSWLFNIFSYYFSQGINSLPTNFVSDSVLNVNGIRPEGIGRTILPDLLGSHRVSSVFLEPVSLGNIAVIVAAWGLAKSREDWKNGLFYVASAVVMISLSDSRYGIGAVSLMLLLRVLPLRPLNYIVGLLPLICLAALVMIGLFYQGGYDDNILGRLYASGKSLLGLNVLMLFGIEGAFSFFYDMGYPYIFTRLGLPLAILLWFAIWMIRMPDSVGSRFRMFIALYIALILCISGTSMFALKTAGILWFLIGSCAGRVQGQKISEWTLVRASPLPPMEARYAH